MTFSMRCSLVVAALVLLCTFYLLSSSGQQADSGSSIGSQCLHSVSAADSTDGTGRKARIDGTNSGALCDCSKATELRHACGKISNADREQFHLDGAVVLRDVIPQRALDLWARAVQEVRSKPGPFFVEMRPDDTDAGIINGSFWEDFRRWHDVPELIEGLCAAQLGNIAADLLSKAGDNRPAARLHHDHVLVKESGSPFPTPLHQDQPYYPLNGTTTVSIWVPLDHVPRESALEFVRGSHAAGVMYMPRSFKDNRPLVFADDGQLPEVPEGSNLDADSIVGWEMQPGDVVAFNFLTLHRAGPTFDLDHIRRAVSFRFFSDPGDVIFAPRPKRTSPPFPELDMMGLAPGQALNVAENLYPVVPDCAHSDGCKHSGDN